MDWLINELLGNIFNNIRLLVDYIASPFLNPLEFFRKLRRGAVSMPAGAKRALVFLFVTTLVITLGVLTWVLGLDRHASGPYFFRKTWMGWLALLGYLILKVFVAVLRQLSILPPLVKTWPDISRAMEAGRAAVADLGIRIDQIPVFLVVGLSRDSEAAFTKSSRVGTDVLVDDPELPVHWYGDENAIWITLPAVSAVSAQAENLRTLQDEDLNGGQNPDESVMSTLTGNMVTGRDRRRATQKDHLISANDRAAARSRLKFLCQELRDLRSPVCAANGVLLMLPYNKAAMVDSNARNLSQCVKTDMTVLQEDLGTRCLTLTVLTANQDNPPFRAYIENLEAEARHRRCGVSFPQLMHLEEADATAVYDWLIRDFELQAMHLYRQRPGAKENESIFAFMDSFRKSQKFFSNMLLNAYPRTANSRFYFGGVYLAELSQVGEEQMPFTNGVLAKMTQEHDEVISWSDLAIQDDRRNRRISWVLFTVSAIMILVSIGLVSNLVSGMNPVEG